MSIKGNLGQFLTLYFTPISNHKFYRITTPQITNAQYRSTTIPHETFGTAPSSVNDATLPFLARSEWKSSERYSLFIEALNSI